MSSGETGRSINIRYFYDDIDNDDDDDDDDDELC